MIGVQSTSMNSTDADSGSACLGYMMGACAVWGTRGGRRKYGGGAVVFGNGHTDGLYATRSYKAPAWLWPWTS
jgi:hypothetical protein